MGFLSKIFGVSESKPKLRAPELEPEAAEFQKELFPVLERGLRGEGLTPGIDEATRDDLLRSLGEEFTGARRTVESQINRTIPRADVGVRSFLTESLKRQFARRRQSIERGFEFRGFEDKEIAQNLAIGAVGGERKVATDILNATNQSILRRSLSPTFGSELAGGVGGAAGIALAGGLFKGTSQTGGLDPGIPVTGSPGVTGTAFSRPTPGQVGFFQQFGTK
jgi:hypothetical protein